jgi:hypothetical protein
MIFIKSCKDTTTRTKPLVPNKLGYVRNESQSESQKSLNVYNDDKRKKCLPRTRLSRTSSVAVIEIDVKSWSLSDASRSISSAVAVFW